MNLIGTAFANNMNSSEFMNILKENLNEIDKLEESDVVSFKRSVYSHDAILFGNICYFVDFENL